MGWPNNPRPAKSLLTLLAQVNKLAPNRNKTRGPDGMIGDERHQASTSDHNPWVKDGRVGVVTALDITHDPAGGFDSYAMAETLRKNRDPRIKYVISNGRIWSSVSAPWIWRKYHGSNQHDKHVHISVKPTKALYDSTVPWVLALPKAPPPLGPFTGLNKHITATVFNDRLGAYGPIDHSKPVVSLPAAFDGPRPRVRVFGPRGTVVATVEDKGPWYDGTQDKPADKYWEKGTRPRAETDSHTNNAGIDLNPVLAEQVGIDGKGLVDWEFVI